MNWLFGSGNPRPPTAQALTGVSSDYYYDNQNDINNLPVAVAVPIGGDNEPSSQASSSLPQSSTGTAPPPLAATPAPAIAAAARPITPPPAVNPAYQSYQKGSSAQGSTSRPPKTSIPSAAPPTAAAVPVVVASTPPMSAAAVPVQPTDLSQPMLSASSSVQPPSTLLQSLVNRGPTFVAPPTILPPRPAAAFPAGPVSPQHATATAQQQHQQQQQQQRPPPSQASLPIMFSRKPMRLSVCPYCHVTNFRTRVQTSPSWKTWLAVLVIVFLFWPLAWVPLVVDCMKTTRHYCPSCQALIGSIYAFDDCCVKTRH